MLALNNDLGRVCDGREERSTRFKSFCNLPKTVPAKLWPALTPPTHITALCSLLGANWDYSARLLTWSAKITIQLFCGPK